MLARRATPLPKHFAADDHVLHWKDVDVLNRSARPLVVEIELADGVHAIAEKLDANGIAHER